MTLQKGSKEKQTNGLEQINKQIICKALDYKSNNNQQ